MDCTSTIPISGEAEAAAISRPRGRHAQMCFSRTAGETRETLQFQIDGTFVRSVQSGAATYTLEGENVRTLRGTYGFDSLNRLNLRVIMPGGNKPGIQRELTLPNCQRIFVRDEVRPYRLGKSFNGSEQPPSLTIAGTRWERDPNCSAWIGWR